MDVSEAIGLSTTTRPVESFCKEDSDNFSAIVHNFVAATRLGRPEAFWVTQERNAQRILKSDDNGYVAGNPGFCGSVSTAPIGWCRDTRRPRM